jgi:hypothetical protein
LYGAGCIPYGCGDIRADDGSFTIDIRAVSYFYGHSYISADIDTSYPHAAANGSAAPDFDQQCL